MRALVATGKPWAVAVREATDPELLDGHVLVGVRAVSINRGELHRLEQPRAGWRPGWDFAGVVLRDRAERSALAPGSRVFGTIPEAAWAERIAVPVDHLAQLPDQMTFEQGAALPVATVTAHRVLELWPERNEMAPSLHLWGRRVLVTGGAGGVGRAAIQLARRAGAKVTAVVGARDRGDGLSELGAEHVCVGIEIADGPFDLVLESVGGPSLAKALTLVAAGGTVVTFGSSSREPTTFSVSDFYPSEATLRGYYFWHDMARRPPGADLRLLAELVAAGDLHVDVDVVLPWGEANKALKRLRDRKIAGKAVLTLDAAA